MYLNEKAWNARIEDEYKISEALKGFLELYASIMKNNRLDCVYVSDYQQFQIQSTIYPLAKWMAKADVEYRRLLLRFWEKRVVYHPEEDYEFSYNGERIEGATEAILNESFVLSPCFEAIWMRERIEGYFYSLQDDSEHFVEIPNLYSKEQLERTEIQMLLEREAKIEIYSYSELWDRREVLFPQLVFCPSVKKDLMVLELAYISQVYKKLAELERYCECYGDKPFNKDMLTKTSGESEATLQKYEKEHTFYDEAGRPFVASWHMRFTGIPGRIFFVPKYEKNKILICYIGEKLKNVKYA